MSTEQNYVGRGISATTPPQTAQIEAQAPKCGDYRTTLTLSQSATQDFEEMTDRMDRFFEEPNPIPHLNKLLDSWLKQPSANLDDLGDQVTVRAVLSLSSFIIGIREEYECLMNSIIRSDVNPALLPDTPRNCSPGQSATVKFIDKDTIRVDNGFGSFMKDPIIVNWIRQDIRAWFMAYLQTAPNTYVSSGTENSTQYFEVLDQFLSELVEAGINRQKGGEGNE